MLSVHSVERLPVRPLTTCNRAKPGPSYAVGTTAFGGSRKSDEEKFLSIPPVGLIGKPVYTHFDVYASGNGWSRSRAIGVYHGTGASAHIL